MAIADVSYESVNVYDRLHAHKLKAVIKAEKEESLIKQEAIRKRNAFQKLVSPKSTLTMMSPTNAEVTSNAP